MSDCLPSWNQYYIKKFLLKNIYELIIMYQTLLYVPEYRNEQNGEMSLPHEILKQGE